jgi:cyanate lyase
MRYPEIFSPQDVEEARGLVEIVQEPRLLKQAMLDAEEARKRTEKLRLRMNPGVTKQSLKRKPKALGNAV